MNKSHRRRKRLNAPKPISRAMKSSDKSDVKDANHIPAVADSVFDVCVGTEINSHKKHHQKRSSHDKKQQQRQRIELMHVLRLIVSMHLHSFGWMQTEKKLYRLKSFCDCVVAMVLFRLNARTISSIYSAHWMCTFHRIVNHREMLF